MVRPYGVPSPHRDAGGHRWTFSQSVDDTDPASWGGELIDP